MTDLLRATRTPIVLLAILAMALMSPAGAGAQGSRHDLEVDDADVVVDPSTFDGLEYRSLEFSRGGRSTAVAGVRGQPDTFYFGASGGGVWKTTDSGVTWNPVADDALGVGSIGAIAVAESDPNVVYVGTGSACPRGNVSTGDGMYRSTDAGDTWEHIGLRHAGQIGAVVVHPDDADLVYVAALGHIFGPNEERGVYRSEDGGETWEKVLSIDDETGFNGLSMNPENPREIYASAWRVERKPWTLISGSEDGGIWKTVNGGDDWDKLSGGLPDGLVGKIDVSVSPADPDRVWALIEAADDRGGLYRSDDAGKSWRRINDEHKLIQRPWYYTHVFADPKDENTVYVLNTAFYRSVDGGKTFDWQSRVPHGDNHDLWINPDDPQIMVNGNDGGANVSVNGGESWTHQMNQPTAEIYRVFVDNQYPYRIYGSQQDNSTVTVPLYGGDFGIRRGFTDWRPVGGCESGHIAIDPRDPDVTYAGCYGGSIQRVDWEMGTSREILAYPQLQLGQAPKDLKYRFQWNAPIRLSPHDPDVLYHAAQVVLRSTDHGQSWEAISPDLTTDDPETQGYAGGPITHDSTGVEVYNTIFAFEESPHERGVLWAGSDDGLVHISRDDGETWTDITPEAMPEGGTVNAIELSAHDPARAFMAVFRYREDDSRPYIFRTTDYGESWELLTDGTNGIPETHFVRAIREDPERQGLLYAGTEFGMYVSFDDGAHWQPLQLDLPVTPVTDLQVHRDDLVVATQGRAFWVLENLAPLRQASQEIQAADAHLYQPADAMRGGDVPGRLAVDYYFGELPEGTVTLEILDADGEVVRSFEGKPGEEAPGGAGGPFAFFFGGGGGDKIPVKEGHNRFVWNLRAEGFEIPRDVVTWGAAPGPEVVPGTYEARLSADDWSQSRSFEVTINPDLDTSVADFREQYDLAMEIGADIDELYDALGDARSVRKQVDEAVKHLKTAGVATDDVAEVAKSIGEKLSEVEKELTQVKSESNQDPLNFPPMLDNQYVALYMYVAFSDFEPTEGAYTRFDDLKPQLDELTGRLREIVETDLAEFNEMVEAKDIAPVVLPAAEEGGEEGMEAS